MCWRKCVAVQRNDFNEPLRVHKLHQWFLAFLDQTSSHFMPSSGNIQKLKRLESVENKLEVHTKTEWRRRVKLVVAELNYAFQMVIHVLDNFSANRYNLVNRVQLPTSFSIINFVDFSACLMASYKSFHKFEADQKTADEIVL